MSQPGDGGYPPPYGQQPTHGEQPPYAQQPSFGQQSPYPAAPPPYPAAPTGYGDYPQPQRTSNGLAVAALVCGIIGFLFFGIVLGPLAAIFGGIGLSRANRGASGRAMAIAGLVLGVIDTVVAIILLVALANGRLVI